MSLQVDPTNADALRLAVSGAMQWAKPPRANLSHQQRHSIQELRSDEDIVILPADKGKATVVMNCEDYTTKMMEISNDGEYCVLSRDPTLKVEKEIASALKLVCKEGHISDKFCDQLTPRYTEPPQIYGLPKVHKEGVPMRPIVSPIGSPMYCLAKELARILTPLTSKNTYTVKNSSEFVRRLKDVVINPADKLVSFDVTSLFTQVPLDHALKVVEQRLMEDHTLQERTTIPVPHLVQLTELCLFHLL